LWAQGKADAAIRRERIWDELARKYGIAIQCGYVPGGLDLKAGKRDLREHLRRAFD